MRSSTKGCRNKLGLAVIVVFAIMATSAASASASQPEFKGGFPTKYTLPNHTITYESGIAIVTCNGGGSTTGSITGAKTGTLNTMTFTSCGSFCNQFKTAELESIPVYTNKATKAVSLLLKPKTGTTFATTECGLEKGEIRGSILVPITPTNTLTKEFTLKARGTHGEQVPQEYENEKGEKVKVTLEGRLFGAESFVKCGLSFTVGITTEKYLELQAL